MHTSSIYTIDDMLKTKLLQNNTHICQNKYNIYIAARFEAEKTKSLSYKVLYHMEISIS